MINSMQLPLSMACLSSSPRQTPQVILTRIRLSSSLRAHLGPRQPQNETVMPQDFMTDQAINQSWFMGHLGDGDRVGNPRAQKQPI